MGGGRVGVRSGWGGGQGGCERRIEVLKKIWGGGGRGVRVGLGGGVRVDVNEELQFL